MPDGDSGLTFILKLFFGPSCFELPFQQESKQRAHARKTSQKDSNIRFNYVPYPYGNEAHYRMYLSEVIRRLVTGMKYLTCIIRMTLRLNCRDQAEGRNDCNASTSES